MLLDGASALSVFFAENALIRTEGHCYAKSSTRKIVTNGVTVKDGQIVTAVSVSPFREFLKRTPATSPALPEHEHQEEPVPRTVETANTLTCPQYSRTPIAVSAPTSLQTQEIGRAHV